MRGQNSAFNILTKGDQGNFTRTLNLSMMEGKKKLPQVVKFGRHQAEKNLRQLPLWMVLFCLNTVHLSSPTYLLDEVPKINKPVSMRRKKQQREYNTTSVNTQKIKLNKKEIFVPASFIPS